MAKAKIRIIHKGIRKRLSKDFISTEADCKCGDEHCSYTVIAQKTVDGLQATRAAVFGGKPFTPLSWFRCMVHNREVGGVSHSKHKLGLAVDIPCPASMDFNEFYFRLTNIWDTVIKYEDNGFAHCHNEEA